MKDSSGISLKANHKQEIKMLGPFDLRIKRLVAVHFPLGILHNPFFKLIVRYRERWEPYETQTEVIQMSEIMDGYSNGMSILIERDFKNLLEAEVSFVCPKCLEFLKIALIYETCIP